METERPLKVLFFAWGDSIHARRRIGLFAADPAFDVGLISTFAYEIENTTSFDLLGAGRRTCFDHLLRSIPVQAVVVGLSVILSGLLLLLGKRVGVREWRDMLLNAWLVRRYVVQFKPDVIFLQTLMYPSYLSYVAPPGIPTVVTFWNGDVIWWAKWTGMERAFKRWIVAHGARRADAVTVNSRAALEACLRYGVAKEKTHLIRYPGVDLELFFPGECAMSAREHARSSLNLPAGNIVLCPRGLGGYLNSDVIVEAAARVLKIYPNTEFVFLSAVGDDEVWIEHAKRADALGIAGHLRRVEKVDWRRMPEYYRSSNVMVSIASNDSLPNCMLEAMACGIPVVMGDIPQIREWVDDGRNGYLAPPREPDAVAQAIMRLLDESNPATADFVAANLRLVHQEVDGGKVASRIKELVRQTASSRSPNQ